MKHNVKRFRTWLKAPPQRQDRIRSAIIGAFAGIWIGGLGALLLSTDTMAWTTLGLWALAGSIGCAILGWIFPKVMGIMLYPFSLFGISG